MFRNSLTALILLFILFLPAVSSAQSDSELEFTRFKEIPWLYYSYSSDQMVLKVDYRKGWGYRMVKFRFPDRLALDISFKAGTPKDFKPKDGFPVWEKIDLPTTFVLTDFKASVDEDGMRVTLSSQFPLEYEPSFDEKNETLLVKIPLVYKQEEKKKIRDGIEYRKVEMINASGPNILHLLYIDTTTGRYFPEIIVADDLRRKLISAKEMASSKGAVCAVNGGFFSAEGNHQGLVIRNGSLISYPKFDRPVFARTTDGRVHIGYLPLHGVLYGPNGNNIPFDSIDAIPTGNMTVLLTPGHPSRISSDLKGSKIVIKDYIVEQVTTEKVDEKKWRYILWSPNYRDDFKMFKPGDRVDLEFGLGISDIEIECALGGGPMLVMNGEVNIGQQDEFRNDIMRGRAPRTGVGIKSDGIMMLAVLEGRNPFNSIGGTLEEFAQMMKEYGAVVAMNLDGGGSSAMIIDDEQVSFSLSGSKAVSNTLGIFDKMTYSSF